jgi:hypothetical protein
MLSAASSAAAICCHFALWWKPDIEKFARREVCNGILKTLEFWERGVRRALVDIEARFLERVAGHLRTAPNMIVEEVRQPVNDCTGI